MRLSRGWIYILLAGIAWLAGGMFFNLENPVQANAPAQAENELIVYLFWGDGCPHCAAERPFLQSLAQSNPQIVVQEYEVWYNAENRQKLIQMADFYNFEVTGVPVTFIGEKYWVGYSDQLGVELKNEIDTCLTNGCIDAGAGILTPGPRTIAPSKPPASKDVLTIPLIGEVDLATQSLAVSTLLISFVDGFNPCSVWVLTMLLTLTLHTGSRRKVLLIGLIFLTVTAAVYGLFIAGLFTMLTVVNFVGWIQVVVALVALFFGLVNLKDYFFYKEGLSFTIDDTAKPGIFQRIRRVMDASQSFWGLAGATVVMSAGVSLVEFSCTAGFPVLWTNLLVSQQAGVVTFLLLLLLYLFIYQIDELGIFLVAVFSLKASRLEEKHGRILKLIGGVLMITLAGVMVIDPTVMSTLSKSLVIFGAAFGAILLILLLHRRILPSMGIWIGTEKHPKPRRRRSSH
jgi:thiol-disulfide isomerase/thioredoxin